MVETVKQSSPPMRMCVICRQRFAKRDLTRFVLASGGEGLARDERRTMPGRGYYLCADPGCGERFSKYQGWRAKRKKGLCI